MSERRASEQVPSDQVIVLFGATGDLAKRKLLPGMFHLAQVGLMPERFRIVGAARKGLGDEEFRDLARDSIFGSGRKPGDPEAWERFAESLRFASVGEGFDELEGEIEAAREQLGEGSGAALLPLAAAAGGRRDGRRAPRPRASARRPGDHREALRDRPQPRPAS